ncbi:putative transmembrane protein [Serratia fonticola AU-P3(3)]|nr:putative transmembrane protein [Serratia fonticola AU-P3(3)]
MIAISTSLKHYWQVRPRLLISVGVGFLCIGLLPAHLPLLQRLIVGWNVMAWIYLLCLWHLMLGCTPQRTRQLARKQDESARQVLALVTLGCVVSILAILFELSTAKHVSGTLKTLHLALTGSTLVVSWLLLPTAFTMHYAHLFYHQRANTEVLPLLFPGKLTEPSYWDFAYFSFTIAVATQTADVAVGTADVRKITLLQSVIAFVFNILILGLSINVGAGLLG